MRFTTRGVVLEGRKPFRHRGVSAPLSVLQPFPPYSPDALGARAVRPAPTSIQSLLRLFAAARHRSGNDLAEDVRRKPTSRALLLRPAILASRPAGRTSYSARRPSSWCSRPTPASTSHGAARTAAGLVVAPSNHLGVPLVLSSVFSGARGARLGLATTTVLTAIRSPSSSGSGGLGSFWRRCAEPTRLRRGGSVECRP